jgi:hypothetical protein
MDSGEPGRSAGLEADEKVPRRGGLLRRLQPRDGGRGWTDEGPYRWRRQRNIFETAEVTALMVGVTIAVFFGMVSVGRCLAHQVAMASMLVDARADHLRDRLDRPHQQQDSSQQPQQPMRRRSSSRAGSRAFHAYLRRWRHAWGFPFAEVTAGLTGPARSARYATSDARATGKTGASDRVLLVVLRCNVLRSCRPAQAERPRPPMTFQAGISSSRAHIR